MAIWTLRNPTPYNGGTTTLQALWMGVPVLALTGHNFVGRMGASFLRTLGQPHWTAPNGDAYVAAAVALAQDVAHLRQGRAVLRAHMAASPLCDISNYVLAFEARRRPGRPIRSVAPARAVGNHRGG